MNQRRLSLKKGGGRLTAAFAVVVLLLATTCADIASQQLGAGRVLLDKAGHAIATGNYQAAVKILRQAADAVPGWVAVHQKLAIAYQYLRDEYNACEQYKWLSLYSMGYDPDDTSGLPETVLLVAACEAKTAWLVNKSRLEHGLSVLQLEPRLSVVARKHCEEMRDLNYWSHYSPTPGRRDVLERFKSAYRFRPRTIAENLARRWGSRYCLTLRNMERTHNDLMNSPHHRENILHPKLRRLGVGIAVNANGDYWLGEIMANFGPEHGDE